jgi:hypothetical protein
VSFEYPGVKGTKNVINSENPVPTNDTTTFAVWFRPAENNAGGNGRVIWAHGDNTTERALLFFVNGNRLGFMRHQTGGSQRWEMVTGLTKITSWRCVVIPHDPVKPTDKPLADPIFYIYSPGDPLSILKVGSGLKKVSGNTSLPRPDNKKFRLGNNSAGTQPFKGKIASFVVWGKVLTESQIKSFIYRSDRAVPDTIKMGWDLRRPPIPDPTVDPVPDPVPIDDWTPSSHLGIPSGVLYNKDNPPNRIRFGPSIVAE